MANPLIALLQGLVGAQPQPVDETEVEGITVMPRKKPSLTPVAPAIQAQPAVNPFSPDYLLAAQQAAEAQSKLPRPDMGGAGLWGLLGPKARTSKIGGGLRDILGAVGDGILLGGRMDPVYGPRQEALRMGQALIGYDQDPQAAVARLAQTGAPKSIETAKDLLTGLQTSEDKAAQRQLMGEYYKEQGRSRLDQKIQNAGRYLVPGALARANDFESYEAAYKRLDAMIKRMDPEADPTSAWGLPDPVDWTPESTAWVGTTGGQQIRADTTRESIAQRREAAGMSSADRRAAIAQRDKASQRSAGVGMAGVAQRREAAAAKSKPKASAAAKPAAGGGAKKPLPANASAAYNKGTPAQRAAARKAWAAQGFDTSKLK